MKKNQFKHRIVKIQLQNNQWKMYWNLTEDKFRRIYKKFNPKNAYVSVSQWLNPKNVENKGYESIIIQSDILLDFDGCSKQDVLEAHECMKKEEKVYKLFEVNKTSITGLHQVYGLKNPPIIQNPKERLQFYINEKKRIAEKVKEFNVDIPVLLDINRIRRIKGTYNGNKDCLCYETSLYSALLSMEKISDLDINGRGNTPPISSTIYTYKFVSNKVGKDKYYIHVKVKKMKQLDNVTEKYNIKHSYIFKSGKMYELVGKTVVDYGRLVKILKHCNASNLKTFEKYKQSWIRISSLLKISKKEIIESSPKPNIDKEILKNPVKVAVKIRHQ